MDELQGNNSKLMSDLKALCLMIKTRRTTAFTYAFMLTIIAFTFFLAFNPNKNYSPWFTSIFPSTNSTFDKSNFSSLFSNIFPDSPPPPLHPITNGLVNSSDANANAKARARAKAESGVDGRNKSSSLNYTSSVLLRGGDEKQRNASSDESSVNSLSSVIDSLKKCDIFDGYWERDEAYPLYREGTCSLIDDQFNCFKHGRPDKDYQKFRWKAHGCHIPRLNATDMLERLRGRRLVFVGDSLNRNMWESLVCILKSSVKNESNVFEASGSREFRSQKFYSFVFKDYNCSVELFWAPFLVQDWRCKDSNGTVKETLRLDVMERSSPGYSKADILIFNTGHWWTHEKTSKGKDYYQEGNHIYSELNVDEAFGKAMRTWGRWIDDNVDSNRTLVFFRGYSASHFSGGRWDSGGQCDKQVEPIKNDTYLEPYPTKMSLLEPILSSIKTPVTLLNITRLTDYRKDGHPSMYRKHKPLKGPDQHFQDCSHWCLPGVPDTWNELLYAKLLATL